MTIAAISTPQNTGGIGIIRISGEDAITIAERVFVPTGRYALSELRGYTAAHGRVVENGETIDECIATVFRAPKSYTGENVVELSCHGGLFVLRRALRAVFNAGAVPAEAGEFTKRAFLNGKLDLTEAEAVMNVISAQGEQGTKAALSTLEGTLSKKIGSVKDALTHISAQMGAWVDFPDDEIEDLRSEELAASLRAASEELAGLLSTFDAGKAVTSGIETSIIGKPNVGKSALMNLLSGFDRSIVTDIPGTTRDVLTETVVLGDVILHLSDTAGIRETSDAVESIGVERAKKSIRTSGLILAVFDGSAPIESADRKIIELSKGSRSVAIVNKTDLPTAIDVDELRPHFSKTVLLSAKTGSGMKELEAAVEDLICAGGLDTSAAILTTERQRKNTLSAKAAIDEAVSAVEAGVTADAVNVCVDSAISSLLELTGERASDAVVSEVFSSFCVGK